MIPKNLIDSVYESVVAKSVTLKSVGFENEVVEMAADLACSKLIKYQDGTLQIVRDIDGKQFEQSPKLAEDELTAFCAAHFSMYQDHYDAHDDNIIDDNLHLVPAIVQFWN